MQQIRTIIIGISLMISADAHALQSIGQASPSHQAQNVIPVGTYVPIRVIDGVVDRSSKLRSGRRVQIETVSPLMAGAAIVIPAGTKGEAEVIPARGSNTWFGGGRVDARALFLNLRGRKIRLSGSLESSENRARIAQGATFLVCLDEDVFFIVPPSRRENSPSFNSPQLPANTAPSIAMATPKPKVPVYAYAIADRRYEIVARVEARLIKLSPFHNSADQSKIYDELWERAQKLGADAVINARYGDGELSGTIATGTAIKFTQPEANEVASRGSAVQ